MFSFGENFLLCYAKQNAGNSETISETKVDEHSSVKSSSTKKSPSSLCQTKCGNSSVKSDFPFQEKFSSSLLPECVNINAVIAQLVECNPPKVEVAGSSLVCRSIKQYSLVKNLLYAY